MMTKANYLATETVKLAQQNPHLNARRQVAELTPGRMGTSYLASSSRPYGSCERHVHGARSGVQRKVAGVALAAVLAAQPLTKTEQNGTQHCE